MLMHTADCLAQITQNDFFQNIIPDRMSGAKVPVFSVGGTDKMLLLLGKIGSPALIHLASAVCTENQTGKHTHIAHLGRAASGLPDILDYVKYAFLNDCLLRILENRPFARIIPDDLLTLIGLLGSLEIHGMA